MMRSMFSAISGLRNHQVFMDVIGNNIANVNTVGFKAGRVTFQDILSQTLRGATGPAAGRGGINPMQIGLGMLTAGVDTLHTQGNLQSTGKITDLALQGDGYFVLSDGLQLLFTRDGSFDLGTDGKLINPNTGMRVQGWQAVNGVVDTAQPVGDITIPLGQGKVGRPSTTLTITGNLDASAKSYSEVTQINSAGGRGTVSGMFTGTTETQYIIKIASVDATGAVTGIQVSTDGGATYGATITPTGGQFDIGDGLKFAIETKTSNAVGDTYSFTAFQPKVEARVNVYDSLGEVHLVKITFTKTAAANTWTWLAEPADGSVSSITPTTATNLVFTSTGRYTGPQPAGPITLTLANGATSPMTVSLDFSALTQLSGSSEVTLQTDGAPSGSLVTFQVSATGEVTGIYSNGLKQTLGQIAIAAFQNPSGLIKVGGNMYQQSPNSGAPQIGTAGSGSRGQISTGFLEMSNVDLAQQFTNMIMAERGFQANSRVITTSDEMLQDLVNIKR
jgi:flagellar hook protein FlgE